MTAALSLIKIGVSAGPLVAEHQALSRRFFATDFLAKAELHAVGKEEERLAVRLDELTSRPSHKTRRRGRSLQRRRCY